MESGNFEGGAGLIQDTTTPNQRQDPLGVWDLDWVFVVSTFTPGQSWVTQLFSLQKVSLSYFTLTWIHPKSTKTKVMFICKTISFPFLYLFQIQINSRHLSGSSVRSVERTSCKSKSALAQQTAPDSVQKWKGHRQLLTWHQISRLSRLMWGSEISRWKERKVPTLQTFTNLSATKKYTLTHQRNREALEKEAHGS